MKAKELKELIEFLGVLAEDMDVVRNESRDGIQSFSNIEVSVMKDKQKGTTVLVIS